MTSLSVRMAMSQQDLLAWWGSDVLEKLIPDGERRAVIEAEIPRVPLAFYETPMKLPADWAERPSSMLFLSEAYRDDAARAASLGWQVIESPCGHLDIVNRARELSALLWDLGSGTATWMLSRSSVRNAPAPDVDLGAYGVCSTVGPWSPRSTNDGASPQAWRHRRPA